MRKSILSALVISLLGASRLFAQGDTQTIALPLQADGLQSNTAAPLLPNNATPLLLSDCLETYCSPSDRFWGSTEYLLWWMKSAPLPVPIISTGNPAVGFPTLNTAGAIGSPGTRVLLGDSNVNFGSFSGMRITLGGWIDLDHLYGVEASGFLLQNQSSTFSAGSNATGSPPLYFPRYNPLAGFQDAVPISDPLRGYSGFVTATSTLQLWGSEANAVLNIMRQPGFELQGLVGFRYLDLRESFQIFNTTHDLIFDTTENLRDYFGTHNQFYGAQLGLRGSLDYNRWSLVATVQVALGATAQTVNIQGSINQPGLGMAPGGIFTQPSNIGRTSNGEFGVIPSIDLKASYQITSHTSVFAGFNFLYWNDVVRPGDQIDHSVNISQNGILDPTGVGKLVGPAQPSQLNNRTDFWALGVNFGLLFRF